ncbi:hypothetical protein KR044_006301, partial [Drosophila immigrans]
ICWTRIFVLMASLLVHPKFLVIRSNVLLDPKGFEESIENENFLVELYVSSGLSHSRLYGMLTDLMSIIEGDTVSSEIGIASIDCDLHRKFCFGMNISSYPSLGFFNKSANKYEELNNSVDLFTLLRFVNLPYTAIKWKCRSGQVVELTLDSLKSIIHKGTYFIKFFIPSCPHCSALRPTWKQLAQELKDETVCIADYDCEKDISICKEFNIKKVPTLWWIENGEKVRKYKGDPSLATLKAFSLEMI